MMETTFEKYKPSSIRSTGSLGTGTGSGSITSTSTVSLSTSTRLRGTRTVVLGTSTGLLGTSTGTGSITSTSTVSLSTSTGLLGARTGSLGTSTGLCANTELQRSSPLIGSRIIKQPRHESIGHGIPTGHSIPIGHSFATGNSIPTGKRFRFALTLAMCLFAACSLAGCTSLHGRWKSPAKHFGAMHRSDPEPQTVSFIELNGIERIVAIEPEGLLLVDLLRDHGIAQEFALSKPALSAPSMPAPSLQALSLPTPSLSAVDSQALGLLARNLFTALEDSDFDLADPLVIQRRSEMLARIRQVNPSVDPQETVDRYIQQRIATKRFEMLPNELVVKPSATSSGAGEGRPIEARASSSSYLVCLRRKGGEEIQIGVEFIASTPLGGILLAGGDRVALVRVGESSFESAMSLATENRSANLESLGGVSRVLITGMSQSAGQAVEVESGAGLRSLKSAYGSPYANVVVHTRVGSSGKLIHRICPMEASGEALSETAGVGVNWERWCDGDILEFSHVELLPIVVGSRAEHRRMQLESLGARTGETQRHRGH